MNAGGKKAVLWGTALDNLASWRMVTPDADWMEVERLDHNLGKIHDVAVGHFRDPPLRRRRQDAARRAGNPRPSPAAASARPGWARMSPTSSSSGLPGIQKEGCDGIITSARFILHRLPAHTRTVCLEFFGQVRDAVPAIVEIKDYLDAHPDIAAGRTGTSRRALSEGGRLRHQGHARARARRWCCSPTWCRTTKWRVGEAASEIVRLANAARRRGLHRGIAEARKKFWLDRARTAAIAAHTNAFKINEDVVIPLPRLGDYCDGIERINIELSIAQQAEAARCAGRILRRRAAAA